MTTSAKVLTIRGSKQKKKFKIHSTVINCSTSFHFRMPSTGLGKNKSGQGMKILWIPGRKKHHDKGVYKPTNYKIEHKHDDQKNEAWSLGGSKMHDEIVTGG